MKNQTKFLEVLGAGGLCLIGLALLDVAIGALKRVTEITHLWKSCGVIGGVLLAAYLVLGVFDGNSHLRQGVQRCWSWLATSLRRRKKYPEPADTGEAEGGFQIEEWKSPAGVATSEASTNGPASGVATEQVDDEEADEPSLVGSRSHAERLPK